MKATLPTAYALVLSILIASPASAAGSDRGGGDEEVVTSDASPRAVWVSPTLLVTAAGALPAYGARVTMGTDGQSPHGVVDAVQPIGGAEVGLGQGFTVGAGTQWVGGDSSHEVDGLNPYVRGRLQLFGTADGEGWTGGVGLAYKQTGFHGGDREVEGSFATRYRRAAFELGLEAVLGQSLRDGGDHDGELHAYAVVRPVPAVALGAAGQLRQSLSGDDDADHPGRKWDLIGGGIASVFVEKLQIGALVGATTVNLVSGTGFTAEAFVAYRF